VGTLLEQHITFPPENIVKLPVGEFDREHSINVAVSPRVDAGMEGAELLSESSYQYKFGSHRYAVESHTHLSPSRS